MNGSSNVCACVRDYVSVNGVSKLMYMWVLELVCASMGISILAKMAEHTNHPSRVDTTN